MDRRLLLGIGDTRVISVWGERWSDRRTMGGRAFAANADDDAAAHSAVQPRGHRQQAALNDQRFDHSVNPAGADSSRARGGAERRAPAAELPAIRPTRWRRLGEAAAAGRRRNLVLAESGSGRTMELGRSGRTGTPTLSSRKFSCRS